MKSIKLVYDKWNTSYRIRTNNGIYLFKILNFQSANELMHELEIVKRLKDKIPIPYPILSKEKEVYVTSNGKKVIIYPFLNGRPVKRGESLSEDTLYELGKYFGTIHDTRHIVGINKHDKFEEVKSFFDKISRKSRGYFIAKKTFDLFEREGFNPTKLPQGLIHADLNTENMLFEKGDIVSLLDFEDAHIGAFIFDLGICILDTCWRNRELSEKRIKAIVKGYESIRKLTKEEKKHLIDAALFAGLCTLYYSARKNGIGSKLNFEHYVVKRFIKLLDRAN